MHPVLAHNCPYLTNLTTLDLKFHSLKASTITELFIGSTKVPQATMKSIFSSPRLSNLEVLEVLEVFNSQWSKPESYHTQEWIGAFLFSPKCSKLRELTLSSQFTDLDVFTISQSPHLSNPCKLELFSNPTLTDDSLNYLAQSKAVRLNILILHCNSLA